MTGAKSLALAAAMAGVSGAGTSQDAAIADAMRLRGAYADDRSHGPRVIDCDEMEFRRRVNKRRKKSKAAKLARRKNRK